MMEKLCKLSSRKPEELVAQMKCTAAFLAAFSYLTGFVFSDIVVTASGVVVPADLDMVIVKEYTPATMLHDFFHAFVKDDDFVALSTKYFLKLRSLASTIYMAFRVYFDVENLAGYQVEFGQRFVSHLSRFSLFDIPPLRAEKFYSAYLKRIVTGEESQFEYFRKKTGEGLSAIWATISSVPGQLFGSSNGYEELAVDIVDEPVDAGNVDKAEAEVEGEDVVAAEAEDTAVTSSSSSGAFKLKP